MAQRGMIERDGIVCRGLFASIGFMTRNTGAVQFLQITEVTTAFKVD